MSGFPGQTHVEGEHAAGVMDWETGDGSGFNW